MAQGLNHLSHLYFKINIMAKEQLATKWVILILASIVVGVYWLSGGINRPGNITEADLEEEIYECEAALAQANRNIEDANDQVSYARDYAWSSYETMGSILEDLSEVETVR